MNQKEMVTKEIVTTVKKISSKEGKGVNILKVNNGRHLSGKLPFSSKEAYERWKAAGEPSEDSSYVTTWEKWESIAKKLRVHKPKEPISTRSTNDSEKPSRVEEEPVVTEELLESASEIEMPHSNAVTVEAELDPVNWAIKLEDYQISSNSPELTLAQENVAKSIFHLLNTILEEAKKADRFETEAQPYLEKGQELLMKAAAIKSENSIYIGIIKKLAAQVGLAVRKDGHTI